MKYEPVPVSRSDHHAAKQFQPLLEPPRAMRHGSEAVWTSVEASAAQMARRALLGLPCAAFW